MAVTVAVMGSVSGSGHSNDQHRLAFFARWNMVFLILVKTPLPLIIMSPTGALPALFGRGKCRGWMCG